MTLKSCLRALGAQICVVGFVAGGATASFAQTLPAPWANRDIGAPAAAGSAAESAGNFTVYGAGTDIWYSGDQFHFVYQRITGDVDIRARVTGVQYIHPWTKGGVMIRESLDPRSRQASTLVTPGKGLAFQRRVQTGGVSTSTRGGWATAPYWVRVVRAGQLFTSYVSPDGGSWTLVGSETIAMSATVHVGLAAVSKDPARTAMVSFANVSVNGSGGRTSPPPPSSIPRPSSIWTHTDVGSPALAGRGSESGGTYSVTGGGTDIWYRADQFHFMHQRADGDMQIVARVVNIEYAHRWSKAGVMIREALTAGAEHAFMTGSAGQGWAFQRRPVAGGDSVSSPGSSDTPPGWVKLVRVGNIFSGYESNDGTNWELVGTETIVMPRTVYVGLAVTSHQPSATATATFSNVRLSLSGSSSSNQRPSVTLIAPATGTTFAAPANITFGATASDSDGTVSHVTFYANGEAVASDTSSPYGRTWGPVPQGTYNLTAVATDNTGATTTSGTATVTVNLASNQPPTAAITSPAHSATFFAPAMITINATANDSNGSVTRVDFYRGSTLIARDSTSPFSVGWSSPPAGTHALTAVAYDNGGASTASAAVNITVTTASSTPSSTTKTWVLFDPSPDHATSVTSYAVAIRRAGQSTTTTPVALKNLGKPTPSSNEIAADISDIVNPLASGSYYAIVTAIGPGGSGASAPSGTFSK